MPKPQDPWDNIFKKNLIRKEAFKRNSLYRQEFDTAFKSFQKSLPSNKATKHHYDLLNLFQSSNKCQKLCHRWGLSFALHPDDTLWDDKDFFTQFFKDPGNAVTVIPYNRRKSIRDGRFLQVEIDLSASKTQIDGEIGYLLEEYQYEIIQDQVYQQFQIQQSPLPPTDDLSLTQCITEISRAEVDKFGEYRKRVEKDYAYRRRGMSTDIYLDEKPISRIVTIFQVWDMNKEGKSAWKIAQELYPEIRGKSPNDYADNFFPKAKRLLRSIERAIKTADSHIKSVTPK